MFVGLTQLVLQDVKKSLEQKCIEFHLKCYEIPQPFEHKLAVYIDSEILFSEILCDKRIFENLKKLISVNKCSSYPLGKANYWDYLILRHILNKLAK